MDEQWADDEPGLRMTPINAPTQLDNARTELIRLHIKVQQQEWHHTSVSNQQHRRQQRDPCRPPIDIDRRCLVKLRSIVSLCLGDDIASRTQSSKKDRGHNAQQNRLHITGQID